jgi:hypothetical protein
VRPLPIIISTLFILTFFIKCKSPNPTEENIEQVAINLANNIDSNSLSLLRNYCYSRRGDIHFWQKVSGDTNLYACSYKINQDTSELTIWQPYNFKKDFPTNYHFDTSNFFEYKFSKFLNKIVKLSRVSDYGINYYKDTLALARQIFVGQDPFSKFSELTAIKDKYKFIATSYRSDIGDFITFWLSPQYKLTYLPDTTKMNKEAKKYWIDDFKNGKEIKRHWSLLKVYD